MGLWFHGATVGPLRTMVGLLSKLFAPCLARTIRWRGFRRFLYDVVRKEPTLPNIFLRGRAAAARVTAPVVQHLWGIATIITHSEDRNV